MASRTTKTPRALRRSDIPSVAFEKIELPNGLQLILHEDRKLPVVHVNQWYHVGSKNERPGRTGFAHLFEHLMFEGSRNAPGGYFSYVEKAGANLREGGVNGTTGEDRTNYFATVPAGNLEYLLWLESDRLATLGEYLTQENLDAQRDVVRNERRQTLENQPYGRAFKTIVENLFPPGHPYSWPVIGSHEDLVAATLDDVKGFFRAYYTPSNLSLCIAGSFDRDRAVDLVRTYFGSIPAGPALDRPGRWWPRLTGAKIVDLSDRVPQDRSYLAWPVPEFFHADQAPLDLASLILTDGLAARLSRLLVYDRQICSNVSSFNDSSEIAGAFLIVATGRPGEELGRIEDLVRDELHRLALRGPSPAELNRARSKWIYDSISGLERIGGFGGKADRLNAFNTYRGNPGAYATDLERHQGATAADVRRVVRQWLDTDDHLSVRFHPEKSVTTTPVNVNRTSAPAFGAEQRFIPPSINTARLANGLEVFVVERHDLPKMAVSLAVRSGSVSDRAGRAGTAHLIAATIDRGTARRSALEIEEGLGKLGTSLSAAAGREFSVVSVDVLSEHLDAAAEILADVALHPRFPKEEFAREKKLHLDALRQEESNAAALAARLRPMLAYGPEHPYGRPIRGLPSTVDGIEQSHLTEQYRQGWGPSGSAIVFAGDITLRQAEQCARRWFGGWRNPSAAAPVDISSEPLPDRGKLYLVDRPGAPQTVIGQVLQLPGRRTPDYHALRLADAVWGGGGFMTRLNLNLREDKGYSYGVFSGQSFFTKGGIWHSSGSVQSDKTIESVVELKRELEGIAGARPITAEEFAHAVTARTRGYAQQFESLSRIAGQVMELWLHGLPLDSWQAELDAIRQTALDAVNDAARQYARPEESILLIVGDRSQLEPQLQAAGMRAFIIDATGRKE